MLDKLSGIPRMNTPIARQHLLRIRRDGCRLDALRGFGESLLRLLDHLGDALDLLAARHIHLDLALADAGLLGGVGGEAFGLLVANFAISSRVLVELALLRLRVHLLVEALALGQVHRAFGVAAVAGSINATGKYHRSLCP
jgi:hypothetical protein